MIAEVFLIGVGKWDEYTKPAIDSIRKHNPVFSRIGISVVDNGKKYYGVDTYLIRNNVTKFSTTTVVPYSHALSKASYWAGLGGASWFIFTNNDVLCTGSVKDFLRGLKKDTIYAQEIHKTSHEFEPRGDFINGWFYAFHRNINDSMGGWDTNFKTACFEDADFTWRAIDKGFKIQEVDVPFIHLEKSDRAESSTFLKDRKDNIRYLCDKYGLKTKKI